MNELSRAKRAWVYLLQALTIGLLLGGWEYLGSDGQTGMLISTPSAVGAQLLYWVSDSGAWGDVGVTLAEAGVGFLLGTVIAIAAAVALASSSAVNRFMTPIVAGLNGIPKIALGPLYLLLFGIGIWSKIYFVATVVFFIPFYSLFTSLRSIDLVLLQNIKILGASTRWLVLDLYLPALIGTLIASLRLTASWAMLSAAVGEMLASSAGIGFKINQGQHLLQNDVVLAGIILISGIVLIVDRLLMRVERHFARWALP